jgi:hypothetical protein
LSAIPGRRTTKRPLFRKNANRDGNFPHCVCFTDAAPSIEQSVSDSTLALRMRMESNSEEVIDEMARASELTIPPEARLGVRLAYDRFAMAAAEIVAFRDCADFEIPPVAIP